MYRIRKYVAGIYRMYEARNIDIPHFRTMFTLFGFLFMHLSQLVLIFNLNPNILMPTYYSGVTNNKIFGMLYLFLITLILSLLFPKKKLDEIEVSPLQIERTRTVIPLYFILNLVLLFALLIAKGIKMGKI